MSRRAVFVPYRPKQILNKGKRPDHWFWTRYSAYPYIGCQHDCQFCYSREQKYSPYEAVQDFGFVIKVKENAAELLRKALSRTPVDVIFTGDYQPAERKFGVSRRMLEVCSDLGFPVFVLERSPLVLRDLDVIQSIREKAAAVVAFSLISTPDSPGYQAVRSLERLAPAPEKRFAAMQTLAQAGIVTGACAMPLLPGLCDDDENLENLVRWTAEHGGQFILSGGLTLSDQQREFFLGVLAQRFPALLDLYRRIYPPGSYSPVNYRGRQAALRLRELCDRYGLAYRVPRPVIPGEKRALNKRIAERLARQLYDLELDGQPESRQWQVRKALWAVEDLEQDIGLIYRQMGLKGLAAVENIGSDMSKTIAAMLPEDLKEQGSAS